MNSLFPSFLIVFDALALYVGIQCLFRRGAKRHAGFELILMAVLGCVFGFCGGVGAFLLRGNAFAIIRAFCHVIFFVMAPLCVLRGVVWLVRRQWLIGLGLLTIGVVCGLSYAHARFVEPYRLEVTPRRLTSPRLAPGDSIRVVVLADLQTDRIGDYELAVLRTVRELEPDLVLWPGDFLQIANRDVYAEERTKLRRAIHELDLEPRLGMFAVMGDVDQDERIFDGTAVRMLRGDFVEFAQEPRLQLYGMGANDSRSRLNTNVRERIEAFDGLSLVMGHSPDFMYDAFRSGESLDYLAIAGHTHGGQIAFPWIGAPITLTRLPRRFAQGVHRLGAATLVVSRGVGMERGDAPRIRFNCRPELVVLDLLPEKREI